MMTEVVSLVERLNLSYHQNLVGAHFQEIVALLSIVFGGSFLLFGWRHHDYFLGITGFLAGGWAGLILKEQIAPGGSMQPALYLAVCSVAGAYLAIYCKRFVGIFLGGFTVAVLGSVFLPSLFKPGQSMASVSLAFLLGGGLGAIFPKFFFVFNSSLIGSTFVTWGVSGTILTMFVADASPHTRLVIHLLVFLPLLVFGVLYQLTTSRDQEMPQDDPAPAPPPPSQPVRRSA